MVAVSDGMQYGDPLLDQLDIHKVVHHRLFRDSCYNHQGNYVKVSAFISRSFFIDTDLRRISLKLDVTSKKPSS